jgi:hypothetical protein
VDFCPSFRRSAKLKNQYFGDVNDYRKYGLLRALGSVTGLPVGVCWLLTADDRRSDGEFRRYLEAPGRWRAYDPELYDHLRNLLSPGVSRSVEHAPCWGLIPGATYYDRFLRDDMPSRREYFEGAWDALSSCPIVFFDPDNGIEVPSKRLGSKDSSKYLYWREIEKTYVAGHSMVIYQHFAHVDRQVYTTGLASELSARLNAPLVDSFRTPHVVFFLIARPEHAPAFERAHGTIHEQWGNQIQASAHVAF